MMRTCFIFFLLTYAMIRSHGQSMLRLPDTGQTGDFTSTWGEDSDFTRYWPYFEILGPDVVIDTITGLMWQRMDGGEMTIEDAWNYCDTLTTGGFDDWRLPTAQEGFTLLNQQLNNPAIDGSAFISTAAEYWWTSEYQANDPNKVWVTNAGGGVGNHPKSETISAGGTKHFHTRAVRNHAAIPISEPRFQDNMDGTVTDRWTQLIWMQNPPTDTLTWEEALTWCDNLNLTGCDDWRLPNIKELQSINEETSINPSIPVALLGIAESRKFWSSTTLVNQPNKAWYLYDRYGITTYDDKLLHHSILPVRNAEICASISSLQLLQPALYPNPFQNQLLCKGCSSAACIVLHNIIGQVLFKGHIQQFNAEQFGPGLYIATIVNPSGEVLSSQTLVKE